jgi:hypothetical protein
VLLSFYFPWSYNEQGEPACAKHSLRDAPLDQALPSASPVRCHSDEITASEPLFICHFLTLFGKSDQGFGNVLMHDHRAGDGKLESGRRASTELIFDCTEILTHL